MDRPNNAFSPNVQEVSTSSRIRRKATVDFGLFFLFFIFYLGSALIQTPSFKNLAVIPVLGMPFGLMMSLLIFPVSWFVIIIWFWKAR